MDYIVNIADIEEALLDLGGEAKAKEIQDWILAIRCHNSIPGNYQNERSFRQTVQRKIEDYCPQAEGFNALKKDSKFIRLSRGVYRSTSVKENLGASFFWVNVGLSYDEVIRNNFLWAPQFGEYLIDPDDPSKGSTKRYFEYWTNVGNVKAGDIIFGNLDRRIAFIAVAMVDAVSSSRPSGKTFKQWNDLGFKVDVKLIPLPAPVSIDGEIKAAFDRIYNLMSKPKVFKTGGEVFQGYMAALPDAAGVEMLRLTGDVELDAVETSDNIRAAGRSGTRTHRKPTNGTTKQAVHDARIGQGYFRQQLLGLWKACPVTGVANLDLLTASHAKPWSKSDDDERLDPYNGFLFAPNIDRLFDKGLISFYDSGQIIISASLSTADQHALGIHAGLSIKLKPDHLKYLNAHRKLFGL